MDFETRAIHEGQEPDPATGAVVVPIYQTSTYVQEAVGEHKGYDYSRVANPTRTALQLCLASLEGAEHGVAYSSWLCAATPTSRAASRRRTTRRSPGVCTSSGSRSARSRGRSTPGSCCEG